MNGSNRRTPAVSRATFLPRLPLLLLLPLLAAGCQRDQVRAEQRQAVQDWLACFECTEGERETVVSDLGEDAVPYLRDALLDLPPVYLENARRSLEIRWSRLQNPPVSRDEYVAHYLGNFEATLQRRAARALGDLGEVAILEEALSPANIDGYRPDVVRVIEYSRAVAGGSPRPGTSAPAVDTVVLFPSSFRLKLGESGLVEAIAYDATGAVMEVPLSWSSTDASIASVDPRSGRPSALVNARAVGTADIRVTAGGESGTSTVTVVSPPPPGPVVTKTGGDGKGAPPNTEFTDLLEVRVTDPDTGQPVERVRVEWRVTTGAATVETAGGQHASTTTLTGPDGRTTVRVHAGQTPGAVRVQATAAGGGSREFILSVTG